MSDDPAYENELLAAGALFVAIGSAPGARVDIVMNGELATAELYVWFDFLKSRYRLTVTFDPEAET
jgi:hypothetical protein